MDTKHPIRKCIGRILQGVQDDKVVSDQTVKTVVKYVEGHVEDSTCSAVVALPAVVALTAALDFPFVVKAVMEAVDVVVEFAYRFLLVSTSW